MFFYLLTVTNPNGNYRWLIWRRESLVKLLQSFAKKDLKEGYSYEVTPVLDVAKNGKRNSAPFAGVLHWLDSPRWS